MPHETLSAAFVSGAVCPEGKRKIDFYDNAIVGFILEVRSSGGKTFSLRHRDTHGKLRQHKIGDAKSITFEKARQAAEKLRSRVVLGEDPSEERKTKRAIPTIAEFSVTYVEFAKGYKRSWICDDSLLRNHIVPTFGACHLDEIRSPAVVDFYHGLVRKGYAQGTANRVLVLFKYLYAVAKKMKVPGAEPDPTLEVKLIEANNARERFLTVAETQRLHEAVRQSSSSQLKDIVALCLLMGNRKRELLDAKWAEFDLERRSWRIPLAKSGKARHVPLSSAALDVLQQLPRFEGCPYVVPNPKTLKPFVSIYCSWNTARKAAGLPEVRLHDLRHSMASNMVNSGRSIYEVAKVLGHTQVKTAQRYSHLNQETLLAAVDSAADATGTDWGAAKPVDG